MTQAPSKIQETQNTNTEKCPVSIVMLTHNSEKKVEDALKSVAWADDIVIVDDLSTDPTVDIAQKYTSRIYHRKLEMESAQKNYE